MQHRMNRSTYQYVITNLSLNINIKNSRYKTTFLLFSAFIPVQMYLASKYFFVPRQVSPNSSLEALT